MTAKTNLELKGLIRAYPVAEVLREISQAELSGSLRVENGEQKAVIYFIDGESAYAVSNERKFRLSHILLSVERVEKKYLAQNRTIVTDLQLIEKIESDDVLPREDLRSIVSDQCESIISNVVTWPDGEWIFNPHARLRPGVSFDVNLNGILLNHAHNVAKSIASERVTNPNEWFCKTAKSHNDTELLQQEVFILSRLDSSHITLSQLIALCGSVEENIEFIYSLWLGGFLTRTGWQAAFSEDRIAYIKSANMELKRAAKAAPQVSKVKKVVEAAKTEVVEEAAPFDLEECLKRIESAQSFYEVLGIERSAKIADIRKAYYRLAKMLHPDRYHNDAPELLQRIEKAFTELGQAHESIKTPEARQNYDHRIRQAERDKAEAAAANGEGGAKGDQAASDFERGFALQLEGQFDSAVPFLARAAYYAPQNPRYRAFYGKALSADANQRHKAEKELVTAVQLEPGNTSFRLMLAEFFIKYKLLKRAEGELNRLLEISPGNNDALRMLDRLRVN
jgi:curved DNA-binding protein CbpA